MRRTTLLKYGRLDRLLFWKCRGLGWMNWILQTRLRDGRGCEHVGEILGKTLSLSNTRGNQIKIWSCEQLLGVIWIVLLTSGLCGPV